MFDHVFLFKLSLWPKFARMESLTGIFLGLLSFLIIGLFHPIVIKAEYYWGVKSWPLFALGGTLCLIASVFVENILMSCGLGVTGFSFFWSILELFQQRKRVEKGWFPRRIDSTKKS